MKTTVKILVVTCIVLGFTLHTQAEESTRIKVVPWGIDASLTQSVVIIATGGVPLEDSGNSIDLIPEGTTVRAIEINDDRLSVEWHGQHGWIDKNDAVSMVDAIDCYSQKISRTSTPNDLTLRG